MNAIIEELHYLFVDKPHLDAFPGETLKLKDALSSLPLEQSDAIDRLKNNASLTAFQAGLRLGLALGLEAPPAP